jgi:co-chaperonin GroES (HSP10)
LDVFVFIGHGSTCPSILIFPLQTTTISQSFRKNKTIFISCRMDRHFIQALFRKLQPLGDRILVKRAPKEVQTSSGIYLPTDSTKDPNEGEVMAVGPGERDVTGTLHATTLAVGDKVLLPEYGGTKVKLGSEEVFMFRESDILGKFE